VLEGGGGRAYQTDGLDGHYLIWTLSSVLVGGEGRAYHTDGLDGHYLIWALSSFTNNDVQKTNPY